MNSSPTPASERELPSPDDARRTGLAPPPPRFSLSAPAVFAPVFPLAFFAIVSAPVVETLRPQLTRHQSVSPTGSAGWRLCRRPANVVVMAELSSAEHAAVERAAAEP